MRARYAHRAAQDLLYLSLGLLTSVLAFAVWVTGLTVSLTLALLIFGLPVILASAAAFRWTAELDRRNARLVLGRPVEARYADHRGQRFLARLLGTLRDPQTWRDLSWLVIHSVVGFGFGVAALTLVGTIVGVAAMPLWYWVVPDGVDWGVWTIDSVWIALAVVPFAVPLALITYGLLRAMALGEARLARALLGPVAARPAGEEGRRLRARHVGAALPAHLWAAGLVGGACTLIWALTTRDYFWPAWVWLGLGTTTGYHALGVRALSAGADPHAAFRVKAELSALVVAVCIAVWAIAGGGYFWPVWPTLGLAVALGARWVLTFHGERLPWIRERRLSQRVDELTRTRRGAVDVQAAELRRIERDLHDGAQARLVALSMQLGRAEARLADQPEAAELLRQARGEASAAIAELRDLARGIAPPVLADRGLEAAVEALGRRAAIPVTLDVRMDRRPPPVLETAAYFVVAEALTNAAKHAGEASAHVTIALSDGRLAVEVVDDGRGGADPAGGGLTGLRHRVEALDGSLRVTSDPGQGSAIRAELPCE